MTTQLKQAYKKVKADTMIYQMFLIMLSKGDYSVTDCIACAYKAYTIKWS